MKNKKEKLFVKLERFDYTMLFLVVFLAAFGLLMIYSASSYTAQIENNNPQFYLEKQIKNLIVGTFALVIMMKFNYKKLNGKASMVIFVISLITVLLVKTGLGMTVNGATRWVNLKVISFQPAELVKLAVILLLATIICKMGIKINHKMSVFALWVIAAIPTVMILVLTKNLSSAIIIFGIAFVMSYVASKRNDIFIIVMAIALVVVAGVVLYVSSIDINDAGSFRLVRVAAWLNPEQYPDKEGYQTLQSLYAIGSGGIFGKGLGNSLQKLKYIPEAQNDMIFSIICEELGLFGALLVIIVFAFLLWRIAYIAVNARDMFGTMVATGVFAHIAIQVVMNVAVVTNLIPNTGVSLPFISYGGSSVAFLMAEMGIVLNISSTTKNGQKVAVSRRKEVYE